MAWTDGEIITESRMVDLNSKRLIDSSIFNNFNLLKIYDTNIFTESATGTGNIAKSHINGTIQLTCPTNNDEIKSIENDQIVLSGLPRIIIIKMNNIKINDNNTIAIIGLVSSNTMIDEDGIYIETIDSTSNWYFTTVNGASISRINLGSIINNDVFIIYATSTRAVLFKNGNYYATHSANIPTNAVSHGVLLSTKNNTGAGSTFTLEFMS